MKIRGVAPEVYFVNVAIPHRQQPFDAIIADVETTGEDGFLVFERVLAEAERLGRECAGILVLPKDLEEWKARVQKRKKVAVLVRPVSLKQLHRKLQELAPVENHQEN